MSFVSWGRRGKGQYFGKILHVMFKKKKKAWQGERKGSTTYLVLFDLLISCPRSWNLGSEIVVCVTHALWTALKSCYKPLLWSFNCAYSYLLFHFCPWFCYGQFVCEFFVEICRGVGALLFFSQKYLGMAFKRSIVSTFLLHDFFFPTFTIYCFSDSLWNHNLTAMDTVQNCSLTNVNILLRQVTAL